MTRKHWQAEWPCYQDTEFVTVDHSFKIQHWLTKNAGLQHTAWHLTSPEPGVQRWYFAKESDKIMFVLRWSVA